MRRPAKTPCPDPVRRSQPRQSRYFSPGLLGHSQPDTDTSQTLQYDHSILLLLFYYYCLVNPFNHPRLSSPSAGLHPSFLLIVGLTYLRSQGVFATVGSPDLETHRPSPPLASRSIVLVFKTGSFWIDALNIPYHCIVWTQPSVVLAFLGTLDDR